MEFRPAGPNEEADLSTELVEDDVVVVVVVGVVVSFDDREFSGFDGDDSVERDLGRDTEMGKRREGHEGFQRLLPNTWTHKTNTWLLKYVQYVLFKDNKNRG